MNSLIQLSLRYALLSMVVTLGLTAGSLVAAQTLLNVPEGQEPQVLRLEVEEIGEDQRDEGWWLKLRQYLGAKIIRPATGTRLVVQSSAYASSPRQTDSTPCITAAGTRVRPGVVATNFLPMGTLVTVNGELHIVEDRMNPRYAGRYLDIWFPSTSQALEFGRRNLEIVIVGYGKPGQELTTDDRAAVPSTWQRAQARFTAFTQTISAALLTRINPNVNRYDVDCTQTAQQTTTP